MILVVGSWFNEVGFNFEISHKVYKLVREEIIKNIFPKFNLNEKDKDTYISLVVTTSSEIRELRVHGPQIRKKGKFIEYELWLPHDEINKAEDPLKEFIKYYFEGIKKVFLNYNVPEEAFGPIEEAVKKEVLNNSEYEYKEEN